MRESDYNDHFLSLQRVAFKFVLFLFFSNFQGKEAM